MIGGRGVRGGGGGLVRRVEGMKVSRLRGGLCDMTLLFGFGDDCLCKT